MSKTIEERRAELTERCIHCNAKLPKDYVLIMCRQCIGLATQMVKELTDRKRRIKNEQRTEENYNV